MNKIFNLKTLGGVLLTVAALGGTACSSHFLDLDNPNQPSSTTFWANENDAMMALTACYDAMQSGNLYNDNIDGWRFGFLCRETCTDNGDHSWGNWMLGSSIAECTSGTKDECFSMYWNANYELIKRCNLLIDNIDRVPMDQAKIDQFRAEALALRSLGYCNLTSVFRDVPYLTKCLTLSEAKAPKTDRETIVTGIIADLKANLDNLPAKAGCPTGRMSREAGYAILGRIALFNKKYDEAIAAYKQVYGKVQLFGDYAALFTEANEYADEVLLGVHYIGPAQGEGQQFGIKWNNPMNAISGSANLSDEFYNLDGTPFVGSANAALPIEDPARYDNRDPRLKATLMLPGMEWNGKVYTADMIKANGHIALRKWFDPTDTSHEYDGSLDYYVIRYSEVLLSYAEALIESNTDLPLAETLIDEVRARVGMPAIKDAEGTGLGQARLREIVRHERRVELAFEDLRFADIYRWNDFDGMQSRMRADRETYGTGVLNHRVARDARDYVWPIPQSEIDTNDMLEQHDEWK